MLDAEDAVRSVDDSLLDRVVLEIDGCGFLDRLVVDGYEVDDIAYRNGRVADRDVRSFTVGYAVVEIVTGGLVGVDVSV